MGFSKLNYWIMFLPAGLLVVAAFVIEYLFYGCLKAWGTQDYGMCGLMTAYSIYPAAIWIGISAGVMQLINYLKTNK